MADIEKVIKGLECRAYDNDFPCHQCAYFKQDENHSVPSCDFRGLLSDAADLLKNLRPKKREPRAKLQCLCGRKRFETWYIASGGAEIRCPGCGIAASGDSEIAAIRAWNAMIIDARSHLKAIREEERR